MKKHKNTELAQGRDRNMQLDDSGNALFSRHIKSWQIKQIEELEY